MLGDKLVADMILSIEVGVRQPIIYLAEPFLQLAASSYNSLSKKGRKYFQKIGQQEWIGQHSQKWLPPCMGALFKGDVENVMRNSFDRK